MIPKEVYHFRKDNGLCVDCGMPAENGLARCAIHAEYRRVYQRERDGLLHSLKLCRCGRQLFGNFKSCEFCLEANAIRAASNKKHNEQCRNSIARKKKAGICVHCSRPAVAGLTLCEVHRKEALIRGRRARALAQSQRDEISVHQQWKEDGRCYCCGSDDMQDGKKLCKSCYAKALVSIKKAQEASPWKNIISRECNEARRKSIGLFRVENGGKDETS